MKIKLTKLTLLLLAVAATACTTPAEKAHFFVQISDPQLGFMTESEDFTPERENMEQIAAAVNRLCPDFVVFTGDYVQSRSDEVALNGFKELCSLFDKNIPLYFVPGNHDVADATPEDVAQFVAHYGHDRFVHNGASYTTIGYNSCVIKTIAEGEQAEYEWLCQRLEEAAKRGLPIILAAHHPIFVDSLNEEDAGVNLPLALREKYLNLFEEFEVDLILSGHLHHCVRSTHKDIALATSGAAGRPLGEEGSGITIVRIADNTPTSTFYEIANVPQNIE